jgi:hypothetical protein
MFIHVYYALLDECFWKQVCAHQIYLYNVTNFPATKLEEYQQWSPQGLRHLIVVESLQ